VVDIAEDGDLPEGGDGEVGVFLDFKFFDGADGVGGYFDGSVDNTVNAFVDFVESLVVVNVLAALAQRAFFEYVFGRLIVLSFNLILNVLKSQLNHILGLGDLR
jgi:hypothetical protein